MDSNRNLTRRKALKGLGATAATAGLAGCAGVKEAVFGSKLQNQLDKVRKGAKKYDGNPKKAFEEGYTIRGPYGNGVGYVFTNFDLRDSYKSVEDIDLTNPTVLSFDHDGNLGAVGFRGRAQSLGMSPNLFAEEDADVTEKWSAHKAGIHYMAKPDGKHNENISMEEIMTPGNWTDQHPPSGIKPGDKITAKFGDTTEERIVDYIAPHPQIVTCLLWPFHDNPNGLFASSNPNFAQTK